MCPTRPNSRTNNTIDLLFTNSEHILNFGTLDLNLRKEDQFNIKSTTGRSYLNYNKELFQTQIINANWDAFQDTLDVNGYWGNLERIIRDKIDDMCPLKKMNIKERGDPWLSKELIERIYDKDLLRKIAKRSGSEEDWERAKRARNYITDNVDIHVTDSKKFWEKISLLLPSKKN